MKRCPRCKETKPLEDYHLNRGRRDGHQSTCKTCLSGLAHDRYLKTHPHARRDGPRLVERGRVLWLRSLKAGKPCTDCGKIYPPEAMQWDHLPGYEKLGDISTLTTVDREEVLREIAKCELVCANCHAIRTIRRAGWNVLERAGRYAIA